MSRNTKSASKNTTVSKFEREARLKQVKPYQRSPKYKPSYLSDDNERI